MNIVLNKKIIAKLKQLFFLNKGKDPEGPRLHLVGGITNYIKDLKVKENYNQVPGLYKKDLN